MFPFAAVIKHCWGIGSCKLLGCNQAHVYAIHQDSWDISRAVTEKLTHWSLKKLLPFWYFKCIFYNIYCNLIQILLKFVFLRVQFTISKHWLKFWLGTEQEKKSPDPIITQIYDPIWHRLATMRNSASPDDILDCDFFLSNTRLGIWIFLSIFQVMACSCIILVAKLLLEPMLYYGHLDLLKYNLVNFRLFNEIVTAPHQNLFLDIQGLWMSWCVLQFSWMWCRSVNKHVYMYILAWSCHKINYFYILLCIAYCYHCIAVLVLNTKLCWRYHSLPLSQQFIHLFLLWFRKLC